MKSAAIPHPSNRAGIRAFPRLTSTPLLTCLTLAFLLGIQPASARKKFDKNAAEPDYTKGEKPIRTDIPWNLGATGAKGDIWNKGSRMIHINKVAKDSPADGVLEQGDVILGVICPHADGKPKADARFQGDMRAALSEAITLAETNPRQGQLVLNIWRKGKTMPASLKLEVMGNFSESAPYDCDKTRKIINETAESIIRKGFFQKSRDGSSQNPKGNISNYMDALGLIATGNKQYLPAVEEYARAVAKGSETLDIWGDKGVGTWHAAYRNLFLTEYFLATKDQEVLPGIKALSTYISLGQSGVGTWSHGMAAVKVNGLYGPPSAYGSMNSASVPCAISLILAQKCGIKEKPIDDAVERSLNFFRWYTDKGIPPYGDHPPRLEHDNNGKGSMTAVLFDIAGEKEQARYFSRCTLASYKLREGGHTGNFFSMTWGAPGAARGGPLATQAFAKNMRWLTELDRHHDGAGTYQYQIPGDTKKYNGWSTAGLRLMQHCMPLKAIHMTGKGGHLEPMSAEEVQEAVAAASYDPKSRATNQLLKDLASWSPVVRENAAIELGTRDDDVVQQLIAMLDSPDRYARYGACRGLHFAGRKSEAAVDALADKVMNDEDLTMRYYAIISLEMSSARGGKSPETHGLEEVVLRATNSLLKQAAIQKPKKDPMRKLHYHIASVVFGGHVSNGRGLENVDRNILIPAIKSILQNPNGGARSVTSSSFKHLTDDDLEQLYGHIYVAAKKNAPSGVMFSGGVRNNGANLMAEKQFEEGLPLALELFHQQGWGTFTRLPGALEAISQYGSLVKPHVDEMTEDYEKFLKRGDIHATRARKSWEKIQAELNEQKKLRSIRPYLEAAGFDPAILD